jgi:hypothetical protein
MLTNAQTKLLAILQKGELNPAAIEQKQETLSLLKILAMSQADVDAGRVHTMDEVIDLIRSKRTLGTIASCTN